MLVLWLAAIFAQVWAMVPFSKSGPWRSSITSNGTWLEVPILEPQSRSTESETLGVGPHQSVFSQVLQAIPVEGDMWQLLLQGNSLNPVYPDHLQPPSHHATLVFPRPQKTHTCNSCQHATSDSKGGKLASGTLTCRENKGKGFVIAFNRRPIPLCSCLQDTRALPKEGGASLINIITQASCLESPHMENCILQSVEAAKSPAESIDFYFSDVCDQYLNRIDRACC